MPFPVKNLIEGHPAPATVYREDAVSKALTLMLTLDYSQLPVIDAVRVPPSACMTSL